MAQQTVSRTKVRRRRRFLRWSPLIIVGVLLGLAVVLFLQKVYNPFAQGVQDPLVLVPEDADFVLSIPEFPALLSEVRERKLSRSLARDQGFQEFLRTPDARKTGIAEALQDAFRELDGLHGSLPLGLELLGDVSGDHVLLAGYLPDEEGAPLRFMLVFRPLSWLALAGVNVFMDETLYGWFLKDEVERGGAEVEHFRDSVRIRPPGMERDFFISRVADTVLVSTEGRQLSRIHNAVALNGLPGAPADRYLRLMPGYRNRVADLVLLAGRKRMDSYLGLERRLLELWGPQMLDLVESTLPRVGGEDLMVSLDLGEGLSLGIEALRGAENERDLAPRFRPFPREHLEETLETVGAWLPASAFGLVYLEASLEDLSRVFLERPEFFSAGDLELLDEWTAKVPAFGSRQGMLDFLGEVTHPRIAVIFFREPREALLDEAQVGYLLVCPLRDQERAQRVLAEVERHIRRTQGEGAVKDLVHRSLGEVDIYEPVLVGGVVDDPRVTQPGCAIVRQHLIITNYLGLLEEMPAAMEGRIPTMAAHPGLLQALSYAPRELRMAGVLDHRALQGYLEQSAVGWAFERTALNTSDYTRLRQDFAATAARRSLQPGSREYQAAEDDYVQRRKEALEMVDRPRIAKEIRDHINYFKELFSSMGFFVEDSARGVVFSARLDVQQSP